MFRKINAEKPSFFKKLGFFFYRSETQFLEETGFEVLAERRVGRSETAPLRWENGGFPLRSYPPYITLANQAIFGKNRISKLV
jgi:hypothetical protein